MMGQQSCHLATDIREITFQQITRTNAQHACTTHTVACCGFVCLRRILLKCSASEGVIPLIVPTLQKPWFVKQVSFAVFMVHRSHLVKSISNIRKPTVRKQSQT